MVGVLWKVACVGGWWVFGVVSHQIHTVHMFVGGFMVGNVVCGWWAFGVVSHQIQTVHPQATRQAWHVGGFMVGFLVGGWWAFGSFPTKYKLCTHTHTTELLGGASLGGDVWVHSWYLVGTTPTNTNNPPIPHQQNTHQNQQHREKNENGASGSWWGLGGNPPR